MAEDLKPSSADDIEMPIEVVTLKYLKTKSGAPVRVQCEQIPELKMSAILEALPGGRPKPPPALAGPQTEAQKVEALSDMDRYGRVIIEAGTCLLTADGSEMRPAFWFTKKLPGALNGNLLREGDKLIMFAAVMKLCGYMEGLADEASFSPDEPARDEGGGGTVVTVEGVGPTPEQLAASG